MRFVQRSVPSDRETPPEQAAALRSRQYHERQSASLDLGSRRPRLANFVTHVYEERLHLRPTFGERATIGALTDPDTIALEIAHDGQLPHLGIVRLVLKSDDIARLDGRAVTIYLVGNHYSPDMRPDNLWFGMPLKGQ